jgi:uncharacterized damage-inducible protein DinB
MVRVEHVLDSWKTVREDTIDAVNEFPAGELDYRLSPDLMTFGEIARHILDAGDGLTGLLLAGEEDFATPNFRDKLKAHMRPVEAGAPGLADALRKSIDERTAQLASRTSDFYTQIIKGRAGQTLTRLEMLQFVKEHELTHRAQLFVAMRVKGIVPATTRRRMAKPAVR